ncbi:Endonuclease/exonuclease/phosphatase [Mycotypha africana]|uniref:Endonuclease/exonuclease/phosphatase n=1 Tax=Mycotypha africana TaxID=64632 RepID=UPI0023002422|nr:Endonuclease/exonuclease/phosphatase [Mycotypha africana]KAI8991884.1 Endonuclease/exonuclease/phosphatase [Mycotypha africana]
MTFNIRLDHGEKRPFLSPPTKEDPFDPKQFAEEQPWSIRKWKIADTIRLYLPDVLGLQEPLIHQLRDLEVLLHDEYDWVGVGREDGEEKGEFAAVFYKKQVLAIEDWKTIWLSEEPNVPGSLGWDARHPRIATQITFLKKDDGINFTIFNAHFDHKGERAKEEAAKLILKIAKDASKMGPVFLLGDLNSTDKDPAYITLTGGQYNDFNGKNDTLLNIKRLNQVCASAISRQTNEPVRTSDEHMTLPTHRVIRPADILHHIKKPEAESSKANISHSEIFFRDAQHELTTLLETKGAAGALSGPYGYRNTLTSFGIGEEYNRAPIRIDFIMHLQSEKFNVKTHHYAILSNRFDDGLYISDHRPVLARVSW